MNKFHITIRQIQVLGYVLIGIAILIIGFLLYANSPKSQVPIIFSDKAMLNSLWDEYKTEYIETDTGRTLDKQQDNITTSEGQSYTMLRAAWVDDKETYDKVYKWTLDNLHRNGDHLSSWLFGKRANGTYGTLTDKGGYNSATDADTDIALSLIFAYSRWHEARYLTDAKALINDIWIHDVVIIRGKPYMTANDLEKGSSARPIINPSYLAPYAYRIFAKVDKAHDWNGLVVTSYEVLNQTASSSLGSARQLASTTAEASASGTDSGQAELKAYLPTDWVVIDRNTGAISPTGSGNLTTNFSYDALRTPWRVALDYQWFEAPEAKAYLDRLSFFSDEWSAKGMIGTSYSHDGSVLSAAEGPAMYGGIIGYFKVSDPDAAKTIYEQKLKALFNGDTNMLKVQLGYYDSNWMWFGLGLYSNSLPNLSTF